MSKSELTLYGACDEWAMGVLGPVLVSVWWRGPTVSGMRATEDCAERLRAEQGVDKFAVLVVMDPDVTRPPEHGARLEHVRLAEKFKDDLVATAFVVGGSGLRRTQQRIAFTTTMLLMAPTSQAQRIFDSAEAAIAWIEEVLPDVDAATILAAVDTLRGAKGSRR